MTFFLTRAELEGGRIKAAPTHGKKLKIVMHHHYKTWLRGVHSEMRQTLKHRIFFKRTNYACLMVSNCSLVYSV